jgi:hypothetical protein
MIVVGINQDARPTPFAGQIDKLQIVQKKNVLHFIISELTIRVGNSCCFLHEISSFSMADTI